MMGKRLKEIFGLILINITLVSGSLNAETVYADTQAKIEIEKTEMPLKICVDEENKKTVLQICGLVHRHHRGLIEDNALALYIYQNGSGTQIDTDIFCKRHIDTSLHFLQIYYKRFFNTQSYIFYYTCAFP